MEGTSGKLPQEEKASSTSNWRSKFTLEARQCALNTIIEYLVILAPLCVPAELPKLKEIAARFEEKVYIIASSQADYLDNISSKLCSLAAKLQDGTADNPSVTVIAAGNQNPTDPASQVRNQGRSSPMALVNQSPQRTLLLFPVHSLSSPIQGSAFPTHSLPSVSVSSSSTTANIGKKKSPAE